MKIAVFGNIYQTEKSASAKVFFEALSRHNAQIFIDSEFSSFLNNNGLHQTSVIEFCDDLFDADIAVSIGGDGTFLKTAERIAGKQIPILGINAGRLGFLADVSRNEVESVVEELFSGKYRTEERTMLEISAGNLPDDYCKYALNEVAVLKQDSSSMITINTWLGENYLNSYQADGLIIATPTGSTGYSLSVGGPVLMPGASDFVISPVAPHSLNVRPLVIPDNDEIMLSVNSRTGNYLVSLDGRSTVMKSGDKLFLRKATFKTIVVKRNSHNFLDTLRNKLMWGADKRN
ncbi:MAG: NAD kinase [Bacteroidales bacterium]